MTELASEAAIVPRRALDEVRAALADTRVVTINGARQVGKAVADLPDALVGRMQAAGLDVESTVSRDDYAERIVRGGFPEAVPAAALWTASP